MSPGSPYNTSRQISLLAVPLALGAGLCCEKGSAVWNIRTDLLQNTLKQLACDVENSGALEIAAPEDAGNPKARFLAEIVETCSRICAWMISCHTSQRTPLVLGGDHSIAVGTVAGTSSWLRDAGKKTGLLWMDAHADMNTPETSPSGNVHGMALAALLGLGPEPLASIGGFSPKIDAASTALVGVRDVDQLESETILRSGIRVFTMREIDERGMFEVMQEAIAIASNSGNQAYHLSLDMDALDPSVAPGVSTPVPGGLTYREAHLALEMIADSRSMISLDVVEVNPVLDTAGLTARVSAGLIASALGKSILPGNSPRR